MWCRAYFDLELENLLSDENKNYVYNQILASLSFVVLHELGDTILGHFGERAEKTSFVPSFLAIPTSHGAGQLNEFLADKFATFRIQ